eukprot:344846-Amphidinium_carterae.3
MARLGCRLVPTEENLFIGNPNGSEFPVILHPPTFLEEVGDQDTPLGPEANFSSTEGDTIGQAPMYVPGTSSPAAEAQGAHARRKALRGAEGLLRNCRRVPP